MSAYDGDYPPRDSHNRAPYPEQASDYASDSRRPRQQQRFDTGDGKGVPPPPLGDGLRPAMKRAGSQSRTGADMRPAFPDEASYLGGRAPDLEAKNGPRDRRFRDKRDGYESEEGDTLRNGKPRRAPRDDRDRDDRDRDSRRQRPKDRDYDSAPPTRRADANDDRRPPRPRRDRDDDDDAPPRRRKDRGYDDDLPPRRRGDRTGPEVEYGSEPIPARRQSERRPEARRPRPRDYDDYDDDNDYRPRRHRSQEDAGRRPRRDAGRDYQFDRDGRNRRDDPYDEPPRRRDSSRRRYNDAYSDDDKYDRRDRDGRRKPAKEIKIGKYDVGPLVQQGQKHYATLAPIVTPLVLNYARKYLSGGGGGGGRR